MALMARPEMLPTNRPRVYLAVVEYQRRTACITSMYTVAQKIGTIFVCRNS